MAMKDECKQIEELLPDLAEGKLLPEVQAHVDSCSECAMKLEQFRTILKVAEVPILSAPAHLIRSAKALQTGERKVLTAKLFSSSLTLANARSTATDFQLVVGTEEHKLRLMYSRVGTKWEVTGRAPSKKWRVSRVRSLNPDGGFVFQADSLDKTDFSISLGEEELQIPSAQELLDGNTA